MPATGGCDARRRPCRHRHRPGGARAGADRRRPRRRQDRAAGLGQELGRAVRRRKAASLEAYELHLLGIEHKHRFTREDYLIAEDYFLRSTAIDPGFARSWASLALIQDFLTAYAAGDAEFTALDAKRRAYVARAVAADPDDPATLLELCKQAAVENDPAAAERAVRRAVARAPNDADILAQAAWTAPFNAPIGRDAVAWADRALALNPGGPDWYLVAKGVAAFAAGDDAAAAEARRAGPDGHTDRAIFLAAAEAMLGNAEAARAAADEVRSLVPGFDLAAFMEGYRGASPSGFRERLREGAVRAGLGGATAAD